MCKNRTPSLPCALVLAVCFASTLLSGSAQDALTNQLVAYFPFAGSADDASGQGHHGTVHGAELTEDRFGKAGQAYAFNGTDAFIEGIADGLPVGDRTISAWFKLDAGTGPGSVLLAYGGGNTGESLLMALNTPCDGLTPPNFGVWPHGPAHLAWVSSSLASPGGWTHWVVTVEGGQITTYVNGAMVGVANAGFPDTRVAGKQWIIGSAIHPNGTGVYADGCAGFFSGSIDDLRLYNRVLSAAEVRYLNRVESDAEKTMSIEVSGVKVTVIVEAGRCYQLERSGTFGEWITVGGVTRALSRVFTEEVEVDSQSQYFRLNAVPCPN